MKCLVEKKVGLKLHKDAVCGFEQILEVVLLKTMAVRPLTTHLTKINETCQAVLEKQAQTQCSFVDSYIQCWPSTKIYVH